MRCLILRLLRKGLVSFIHNLVCWLTLLLQRSTA